MLGALGAAASIAPWLADAQTFTSDRVPALSSELWRWVGAQLVLEPGLAWFDTANFGPTLRAVLVRTYRRLEDQSLDFRDFDAELGAEGPGLRAALGAANVFFSAKPGELAFTHGARTGLAYVAAGIDLQSGDEILTSLLEHPAAVYPWLAQSRRRGIRVVQVPTLDAPASTDEIVQRYSAAMTPRTRVLLLSHVRESDGAVLPVRDVCTMARTRGVLTVVDGTAAAGQVDVRLGDLGCDVCSLALDRWLNGPADAGLLYVRREAQSILWPVFPDRAEGWDSTDRYGLPTLPDDADFTAQRRYGNAITRRGPLWSAAPLCFELQDAVARPRFQLRVRELAQQVRTGLERVKGLEIVTPRAADRSAGIVTMRIPGRDLDAMVNAIANDDRIVVGRVRHGFTLDALRVSVHPGNDPADVDRCVAAIQRRV
jgi:selenocysteine lyase/cysteine desulfurase